MTADSSMTRRRFFQSAGAGVALTGSAAIRSAVSGVSGALRGPDIQENARVILFFDDYMVESLKNVQFVVNQAVKAANNPVIRSDRPWEGKTIAEATVFYDEDQKLFRMWYPVYNYHPPMAPADVPVSQDPQTIADIATERKKCTACYAVSEDGYHWEKPALGLVEFAGSKANNILIEGSGRNHFSTGHVFRDPVEADPARRYKGVKDRMLRGTDGRERMTLDLYYSPDGFSWTPYSGNPVYDLKRPGTWGPTSFMGWDSIRRCYAVYMENCGHQKCPIGKRLIGRAESPDMIHWSEPDTILVPDEVDGSDQEPYALHPCVYEQYYVGLVWIYSLTRQDHHPQLVFSRDGIRFDRRYRAPFISRGAPDEFDSLAILPLKPILHGDKIFIYYIGTNYRTREQFNRLGEKNAQYSIGLAVIPKDGFVYLESEDRNGGEIVTRSVRVSGKKLCVNMQVAGAGSGELKMEILDPAHFPISGFALENADPLTGPGCENVVTWNGNPDIGRLAGRLIKLRIYLNNARLFAIRFVD